MARPVLLSEIPGLTDARAVAEAEEEAIRESAFLELLPEVCGVPIRPITPRIFHRLLIADSPFITRREVTPDDVLAFLWMASPRCVPGDLQARDTFHAEHDGLNFQQATDEIDTLLDQTFMDAPGGRPSAEAPITCTTAALVHGIASHYHWPRETILDLPLIELFQYRRLIRADKGIPVLNKLSGGASQRVIDAFMARHRAEEAAADGK